MPNVFTESIGDPRSFMRTPADRTNSCRLFPVFLHALFLCFSVIWFWFGVAHAEEWAFAVISDHRSAVAPYRNVLEEIRDMKACGAGRNPSADFILAVGDVEPVKENLRIVREVFGDGSPVYFPVMGNHERKLDLEFILGEILPKYAGIVGMHGSRGANYHVDWKNVRLVVLDQYSDLGRKFNSPALLAWLENSIASADAADHIFIAFHEPYTPHDPSEDPFWSLLLKHRDKVRAVFSGHTHWFNRRMIPDSFDGIQTVNSGTAGWTSHSDGRDTFVGVLIDGKTVTFQAVGALHGTRDFKVRDRWRIGASREDGAVSTNESKPDQAGVFSPDSSSSFFDSPR